MGRLTKDPDVRYSAGNQPTAVARYTLAVDRMVKKEGEQTADFVPCVAFGKAAEFVQKYLHQGMKISVVGRIQTGSYTDKDGKKQYTQNVVVNDHYFCEAKRDAERPSAPPVEDGFMQIPEGEDFLPFG